MNRTTIYALFTISLIANISLGLATESIDLPLPPGAKEIKHLKPEGAWLQTNYVIEAKYPDNSVAEFYLSNIKAPWSQCFIGIPEWQSLEDISNSNNRFVYQRLMYWINRKERKLLVVGMFYYSPGHESNHDPDNKTQRVVVAEYPTQDIDQITELMKLKCEK